MQAITPLKSASGVDILKDFIQTHWNIVLNVPWVTALTLQKEQPLNSHYLRHLPFETFRLIYLTFFTKYLNIYSRV